MQTEVVPRQLGGLSASGRSAALMADAPELAALLSELTTTLDEVRGEYKALTFCFILL